MHVRVYMYVYIHHIYIHTYVSNAYHLQNIMWKKTNETSHTVARLVNTASHSLTEALRIQN